MKRSMRENFWWFIHNVFAHPLSEAAYWVVGEEVSNWVHDATIPKHKSGTGKG